MESNYPNILLVSGNGRNSGKTTLACKIIERFSKDHEITGLKISPHFHPGQKNENIIANEVRYLILQELNNNSGKDSSRMLHSGAKEVYYMQVKDDSLNDAFNTLIKTMNKNSLIVCESGGLRRLINPGAFLLLTRNDTEELKAGVKDLIHLADNIIKFDGEGFDFDLEKLSVSENTWSITE